MDLDFLIGREIVTNDPVMSTKYTIIEAYPFMVKAMRIAENGTEIYECFSLGDLVTKGMFKSNGGPTKHGCRHYWRADE